MYDPLAFGWLKDICLKILIVEDDLLVANSLEFLLQIEGHSVTGKTSDLDSTLTSLEKTRPDVALVDIHLAMGSHGYDVAMALRQIGVPCIFASYDLPDSPRPDLAIGCLQKPYSVEGIIAALDAVAGAPLADQNGNPHLAYGFQPYH